MDSENPYRPPRFDLQAPPPGFDYWREDHQVVVRHGKRLPPVCFYCGSTNGVRLLEYELYWQPPLLRLGRWVMIAATTHRAQVGVGHCRRHWLTRYRRLATALTLIAGALAAAVLLRSWAKEWVVLLWASATAVSALGLLILWRLSNPLQVARIDADCVWLDGAAPSLLAALPTREELEAAEAQ